MLEISCEMIKTLITILLFSFSGLASAEQTVINDYNDARDNYFYDQLYVGNTGEYPSTAEYSAPYKTT